jgi:hypothetical protein
MESALVVAVTIVAVRVVLVTLVPKLEFSSASPLVARREFSARASVEAPNIIGLSKIESRLSPAMGLYARDPSVGAETR